jgi:predicted secreted protein
MSFFETFPIFFFFLLAFLFVVLSCTYFILRETTEDDSITVDAAADAKDLWNGSRG